MRPVLLTLLLLVPSVSVLPSCATFKSLLGIGAESPRAQLKSIVITGFSEREVNLLVTMTITNTNKFEIGLNNARYNISLFGTRVSQGNFQGQFKVAGEQQGDLDLPLTIDLNATRDVMTRFINQPQDIVATVDANLEFSTPVGAIESHFVREKKITMGR